MLNTCRKCETKILADSSFLDNHEYIFVSHDSDSLFWLFLSVECVDTEVVNNAVQQKAYRPWSYECGITKSSSFSDTKCAGVGNPTSVKNLTTAIPVAASLQILVVESRALPQSLKSH